MAGTLKVSVTQPPAAPNAGHSVSQAALLLLEEAGRRGADLACLPECLNVMGQPAATWAQPGDVEPLRAAVSAAAKRHGMYVVLPLLERRDGVLRNTAYLLDRDGQEAGRYDKTHLTANERDVLGVVPGDTYLVFQLDCGRAGIMTCYDGHFPEVARTLALDGADIILFPSLQRHLTRDLLLVQVRSRAVDNSVYVARASYGHPAAVAWTPGMMVGASCIVDHEGTVLADAGRRTGVLVQEIDLGLPHIRERSFGGEVGDARDFLRDDRRPETYGRLLRR